MNDVTNEIVVDCSIVVKSFLEEVYSTEARQLLSGNYQFVAPDLVFSEIGNVIWKNVMNNRISPTEATIAMLNIESLHIATYPVRDFASVALEIAMIWGRSFYDSTYIALAMKRNCPFFTADLRLYNALKETPLSTNIMWIADVN